MKQICTFSHDKYKKLIYLLIFVLLITVFLRGFFMTMLILKVSCNDEMKIIAQRYSNTSSHETKISSLTVALIGQKCFNIKKFNLGLPPMIIQSIVNKVQQTCGRIYKAHVPPCGLTSEGSVIRGL